MSSLCAICALHATCSAVRVWRAGRGVYDCCFKGKVRGAGQGSSAVAETALTTHVQLLVPAIQTNHYLMGCKPAELKVCLPSALYTTDFSNASPPAVQRDTLIAQGCSRDLVGVTAQCADHSPAVGCSVHSKLVGRELSVQLQQASCGGKRPQGWAADIKVHTARCVLRAHCCWAKRCLSESFLGLSVLWWRLLPCPSAGILHCEVLIAVQQKN